MSPTFTNVKQKQPNLPSFDCKLATSLNQKIHGCKIFSGLAENVVLFKGSHRFLDTELPQLLEIMRTPGGARVPDDLRLKIRNQIITNTDDLRLDASYEMEGIRGFFAFGASAAIRWEQVARMQQLQVLQSARHSVGPVALQNTVGGIPDEKSAPFVKDTASALGQLVYYFQAVDKFRHPQDRSRYMESLRVVNLSKTCGLMGMLAVFLGMRVRLKKKILAPELVQEATGEVVGICFHQDERFGHPDSSRLMPAESHECWLRGWVRCDYLPIHIEVRWDGCAEDYTGLGKPGVWHLEPEADDWQD